MREIQGVAVSDGIAIGQCVSVKHPDFNIRPTKSKNVDVERNRIAVSKAQVEARLDRQLEKMSDNPDAQILIAHKTMLNDPELASSIEQSLAENGYTAEYAVSRSMLSFVEALESLPDSYMRDRAEDLKDLRIQWLQMLLGIVGVNHVLSGNIIVTNELLPSHFLQVKDLGVAGIITAQGGTTSHTAILARNFGIPMVTGIRIDGIETGNLLAVDGSQGYIVVNPNEELKTRFVKAKEKLASFMARTEENRHVPVRTIMGKVIEIGANIGKPEDVDWVVNGGADGIGLFRTEFLFMDRSVEPTEEEQLEAYQQVVSRMSGKRVVIRTLDVGADKKPPYMTFDDEQNPFLGVRGLRYTLSHHDLFLIQLKAVLRAASFGRVSLMFPMVTDVTDVEEAITALQEARKLLDVEQKAYGEIEVGAMIEVPAAALIADLLSEKLDFLSVGTNDLIQYTTASDRMNPHVNRWYNADHPGLWRLLELVVQGAHSHGAWVGICGELAGSLAHLPKLLAIGFDELSMSPRQVGVVKSAIREM